MSVATVASDPPAYSRHPTAVTTVGTVTPTYVRKKIEGGVYTPGKPTSKALSAGLSSTKMVLLCTM